MPLVGKDIMETNKDSRNAIAIYLFITFALSSIFYVLLDGANRDTPTMALVAGLMWSPGVAAIVTSLILKRKLSGLGWRWGNTKYQLLGYVLPIAYGALAYGLVWTSGLGAFDHGKTLDGLSMLGLGSLRPSLAVPVYVLFTGTVIFLLPHCILALGEEIGWRGFLVPELSKTFSYTKTALISGAIWSLWHYPYIFYGGYNAGAPMWYSILWFTVGIFGSSFAFTWIRLKSGSLWTGVFLHASHNVFIQEVFDVLTRDTGHTKYFTSEFGVALPIALALVAFLFWRKRSQLPAGVTQGA